MAKLILGIDVGWSEKKKSCGVAGMGLDLFPSTSRRNHGFGVWSDTYTIVELLQNLSEWRKGNADVDGVVVFDGPLLHVSENPSKKRPVDEWFRKGAFFRRAQPEDIKPGSRFVEETYRLVDALRPGGVWPDCTDLGLLIAETNPTVGMACLVPRRDANQLPSRRNPKMIGHKKIRAKSDWYWYHGAGRAVGDVLGLPDLHLEHHHERVAALYCLAVAHTIAAGNACPIGDASGRYVLLPRLPPDWEEPVQNLKRRVG